MNEQVRILLRWLLAVSVAVGCLIYLVKSDARMWVGITALVSALVVRSMVLSWRRAMGRQPLDLIGTMCLSFIGASAATLVIALLETSPGLVVIFFTGYLGALAYGTAAEVVAQLVTWALVTRRESTE